MSLKLKNHQMALWRVLDYTSAPLRGAVKHPPNNSLKFGKSSTLKLSETGRSPLNRLANRPVIFRLYIFSDCKFKNALHLGYILLRSYNINVLCCHIYIT